VKTAILRIARLSAQLSMLFAVMLCVSGQFCETAGILATPWGEVVIANRSRGVAVDGYGLPRRFAWAATAEDVARWAPDRLFEGGPLNVEALEVYHLTGLYWNIRIAVHHGLLLSGLIVLNICTLIGWRNHQKTLRRKK